MDFGQWGNLSYCFKSKIIFNLTPSLVSLVNLPAGSTTPITCKCTMDIKLEHVLCVLSFHLNLVSTSKLTKALNCCVVLVSNGCILQDLVTGRIIGSGEH